MGDICLQNIGKHVKPEIETTSDGAMRGEIVTDIYHVGDKKITEGSE